MEQGTLSHRILSLSIPGTNMCHVLDSNRGKRRGTRGAFERTQQGRRAPVPPAQRSSPAQLDFVGGERRRDEEVRRGEGLAPVRLPLHEADAHVYEVNLF